MRVQATDDRDRPTFPSLKATIGEDPARWLSPETDLNPEPRIRGISDLETAAAWLAIARRLDAPQSVRDALKDRRDWLAERDAQGGASG